MTRKKERSILAARIQELRHALRCRNQTDFAKRLGTDQGTVSKWESGRQRPTPEVLVRMAQLAEDLLKLYFLEEAGLPPEFLDGKRMLPELYEASNAVVAKALTSPSGIEKKPIVTEREVLLESLRETVEWDRELLIFVIQTVNAELKKRRLALPDSKYAELVTICYEFCSSTGRRDSDIVGRLLRIA